MAEGGCVVDYHGCDFFPERCVAQRGRGSTGRSMGRACCGILRAAGTCSGCHVSWEHSLRCVGAWSQADVAAHAARPASAPPAVGCWY